MESAYRKLTPEQRAAPLLPYLDPGMVNRRRVEALLGRARLDIVDEAIRRLPSALADWQREVRIDHLYTEAVLAVCRDALPLPVLAAEPAPKLGTIVSSTDVLQGSPEIYTTERTRLRWRPEIDLPRPVFFDVTTKHVRAATLRSWLSKTHRISFVAVLDEVAESGLVFGPLVMGGAWLQQPPDGVPFDTMFLHWEFFEHFVEDFDEFQKTAHVTDKIDWSPMKQISERAFKECLCDLLDDTPAKDWPGERSDHFTSHMRLQGKRTTAAFLLKGPGSGFNRMEMTHLGKNGDQIFRLAAEPADVLILQHCHEIGSAVRATLRSFAVQPSRARRYCLIDGRDSFRLLTAYGLVDKALSLS